VDVDEVYCDITALLFDEPRKVGKEDAISDMVLSESSDEEDEEDEDLDDISRGFEIIESGDVSEHNGTVRRWYRGFRH
jgi:hypothetical protein